MRRINLAEAAIGYDADDPEGFRAGMARFGPELGAKTLGTSLYELPPGESVCPYHYECGEEEWLLVLEGRPTLRHPEGSEELEPLDLVFFPRGPEGAHRVSNHGPGRARVLMYSTIVVPSATVYPDSDKIGIWTGDKADDRIVLRSSGVGYWEGETGG